MSSDPTTYILSPSSSSDDSGSATSVTMNSPNMSYPVNYNKLESPERLRDLPYSQRDLRSIFVLPPEILILIFSFFREKSDLVDILPTCKYWASLLLELIWFRPKLHTFEAYTGIQKVLDIDCDKTFLNYRMFIRRLNLCFISSHVNDDFLLKFKDCMNLERLTIVNCGKLTDKSIATVLKDCVKLQSIDMSGVKNITDVIFDALAENCPRLQGVYAPDAGEVTNEAIIKLFHNCPYLKRIKLTKSENINDSAVMKLAENFKYVVEIDLHGCPNITDDSLKIAFHNLEQLREFRISSNKNITDSIFCGLPDTKFLTRLRILDFTECLYITDKSIEKIVQCAPRLRNVVLSKCLNITDGSLRALAQLNKSLHYIHLGHCSNITDFGVKLLVSNCYRLEYIDLACCTQLTNASVAELAHLPRLTRIGLVKCINISDQGIVQLVQKRGPQDTLERVHLSYCTQLTTHPVYLLLQHCPKLSHLSLSGVLSFLRDDFKKFCREPPPDFNAHQRALFCVFSGNGVKRFRDHLSTLYPTEEPIYSLQGTPHPFQNHHHISIPQQQQRQLQQFRLQFANQRANATGSGTPTSNGAAATEDQHNFLREILNHARNNTGAPTARGSTELGHPSNIRSIFPTNADGSDAQFTGNFDDVTGFHWTNNNMAVPSERFELGMEETLQPAETATFNNANAPGSRNNYPIDDSEDVIMTDDVD